MHSTNIFPQVALQPDLPCFTATHRRKQHLRDVRNLVFLSPQVTTNIQGIPGTDSPFTPANETTAFQALFHCFEFQALFHKAVKQPLHEKTDVWNITMPLLSALCWERTSDGNIVQYMCWDVQLNGGSAIEKVVRNALGQLMEHCSRLPLECVITCPTVGC
jgi:hypothetical protein